MTLGDFPAEMRPKGHFSRIDTLELQSQILRKLGRPKAEKYFFHLKRFLSFKMSKREFDKLCRVTIGRENVTLHNLFVQSILMNAGLAHVPPVRDINSSHSWISKISNGSFGVTLSPSAGKGRPLNNLDRKFKDRLSPLGLHSQVPSGSIQDISGSCDIRLLREQQGGPELISVGSKAPLEFGSVEDGEEVEQVRDSPCVQSRSPIRAPLGISTTAGGFSRKSLCKRPKMPAGLHLPKPYIQDGCQSCSELPDASTLRTRLEHKVELENLRLSAECANLLNSGLDAFLTRLIKPCVDLARARCSNGLTDHANGSQVSERSSLQQKEHEQMLNKSLLVSLLDFRIAMESNRQCLGEDWPLQLEKISFRSFGE